IPVHAHPTPPAVARGIQLAVCFRSPICPTVATDQRYCVSVISQCIRGLDHSGAGRQLASRHNANALGSHGISNSPNCYSPLATFIDSIVQNPRLLSVSTLIGSTSSPNAWI